VDDGPLRQGLEGGAPQLEIITNVVFLGHRDSSDDLVAAMDTSVLPSLYERLPMARGYGCSLPCGGESGAFLKCLPTRPRPARVLWGSCGDRTGISDTVR
jgi:hypothetical protein